MGEGRGGKDHPRGVQLASSALEQRRASQSSNIDVLHRAAAVVIVLLRRQRGRRRRRHRCPWCRSLRSRRRDFFVFDAAGGVSRLGIER